MENMFRTTLDIDTNDKEHIFRILEKIFSCKNILQLAFDHSFSKGVHLVLFCRKFCEICRLTYDDFRRFAYDQYRPYYARNILFDTKELGNKNALQTKKR